MPKDVERRRAVGGNRAMAVLFVLRSVGALGLEILDRLVVQFKNLLTLMGVEVSRVLIESPGGADKKRVMSDFANLMKDIGRFKRYLIIRGI